MKNKKNILSILWLVLGLLLAVLSLTEQLDAYWSGMGSALIVVGALQLLRAHRLRKNDAYREKMEIEAADERNLFIHGKAWSWAGYCFILIASISSIVFKLAGQELLAMAASGALCLMLVLYWGAYWILQKKY